MNKTARFYPMRQDAPDGPGYWIVMDRDSGLPLTVKGSRRLRKWIEGVRAQRMADALNRRPPQA